MKTSDSESVVQLRAIKHLLAVIAFLLLVIVGILNAEVLGIVMVAALVIALGGYGIRLLTKSAGGPVGKRIE